MSEGKSYSGTFNMLPFAIAFPLLVIAFQGCFHNGCQGALDAQAKALHSAAVYGGWTTAEKP